MNAKEAINIARRHVLTGESEMKSSAEVCLADAIACYDSGRLIDAARRSADAVAYMTSFFSADRKKIMAYVNKYDQSTCLSD